MLGSVQTGNSWCSRRTWLCYTPTAAALLIKAGYQQRRKSIVADYLGTPTHAYDSNGSLIWERQLDSYGKVRMLKGEEGFCEYLYQGQTFDKDVNLAYNRFRWYNQEDGVYISQDPIGLAGNNPTLYAYVHDPNSWVDIFGLNGFSPTSWTAPSSGTGQTYKVYQRGVDWDKTDSKGRTNLQRCSEGLAPIGHDGKSINLHHSGQDGRGPLFEISGSTHTTYGHTNALHPYRVTPNEDGSKNHPFYSVDREKFDKDRAAYWKHRAEEEARKRSSCP